MAPSVPRTAAFFDVDDTLVTIRSMFDFAEFALNATFGTADRVQGVHRDMALARRAGASRAETNRMFYSIFAGLEADHLALLGKRWWARFDERVFLAPGLARLHRHRAGGHSVVLVSGSFAPCLAPIAAAVGAEEVLCSRPEVVHGTYNGKLRTPMIAEEKRRAVQAMASRNGVSLPSSWAYGDHPSDVPMLESVGHPVVVGGDTHLLRIAHQRNWAILATAGNPKREPH